MSRYALHDDARWQVAGLTLTSQVAANPSACEVLVFVKLGGEYQRISTGIDDLVQLLGVLELAKYDTLQRITA